MDGWECFPVLRPLRASSTLPLSPNCHNHRKLGPRKETTQVKLTGASQMAVISAYITLLLAWSFSVPVVQFLARLAYTSEKLSSIVLHFIWLRLVNFG